MVGYQVLGADVQGATMLSETMAQYSALMVMEKEYGREKMRRFLRYELDRYLSGRGGELIEEMPLELVEDQPYIHYSKGSLALYALRDHSARRGSTTRCGGTSRPYASRSRRTRSSRELLAIRRRGHTARETAAAGRSLRLDHAVRQPGRAAVSRARPDGRYEVTVTATVRKLRSDGKGVETRCPSTTG